jgi:twitching motility two-component system response regulator PilH
LAKILIVEDYPSIQQIYQTVLAREGYSVSLASDGKEALQLVAAQTPDLILLDLLMTNMGGLEFLKTYNLADHPGTKVIVFSNLASPELAQEAKELGASRYLTKAKFTPRELVGTVKEVLAEK